MSTLPAPLEALRGGLNEAAEAAAASEAENLRLIAEVTELTLVIAELRARLSAAGMDGVS